MNENNRNSHRKDSSNDIIVIKTKLPENFVAEQCFDNVVKLGIMHNYRDATEQIKLFIKLVNYGFANCFYCPGNFPLLQIWW